MGRLQSWQLELVKAWRWLIFYVHLLQQMGGLRGIAQAIGKTITILLQRALA
ncbi:MAG: hypothetical protein ACK421_06445 [Pseudanabaenaceae cyanobacterium]